MISMTNVSMFIYETLNTNAEFKILSNALMGKEFKYFVNIDLYQVEPTLPYFGIVTFEKDESPANSIEFKTHILLGIDRINPTDGNNLVIEPTLENIEQLSKLALDIIAKDLRTFGINGDMNVEVKDLILGVPTPEGSEELQMSISITLEQQRFLGC